MRCILDRREFLTFALASGIASFMPVPAWSALGRRRLILIELKGGNDGLNTLVPYADPAYYVARPRIAMAPADCLSISPDFAMHPSLLSLLPAWSAGDLAWVHGLGYDSPNRSHFRSIDIWETASESDVVLSDGWLSRLDRGVTGAPAKGWPDAFLLGSRAGALEGGGLQAYKLAAPLDFDAAGALALRSFMPDHEALRHVLAVQGGVNDARSLLSGLYSRPAPFRVSKDAFGRKSFGRQLELAADLIVRGAPVPVFKLDIAGFDTHVNQLTRHADMLKQLADGLAALREVLIRSGDWSSTLVVTYSEFGRRLNENGNGGTDHGAAAAHMMLGGLLKGGFYGQPPSLSILKDGDIAFTTDFKGWYASIVSGLWSVATPQKWGGPVFDWRR